MIGLAPDGFAVCATAWRAPSRLTKRVEKRILTGCSLGRSDAKARGDGVGAEAKGQWKIGMQEKAGRKAERIDLSS